MDQGDSDIVNKIVSWFTEEFADNNTASIKNSSTNISDKLPYYGAQFAQYKAFYASIHGYISVFVCIFGIIAGIMNIIVLTRKIMISPINIIFTGLAFADMMVVLTTIPYNFHYYIRYSLRDINGFTYGWAVYGIIYYQLGLVFHTISIWLTVTLAIWRYMAVCYPTQTIQWRSLKRAKIATALNFIICPLFYIHLYFTFSVQKTYIEKRGQYVYYIGNLKKFNYLVNVSYVFYSVIIKFLPCIALSVLSLFLIRTVYWSNLRRQQLKGEHEPQENRDRITTLLLVVLLLFIISEFPYGILSLMSAILGPDFSINVYANLLETLEDILLVNCSVNFIIYCSMSRQFRETFVSLFISRWRKVNTKTRVNMRAMRSAQKLKSSRF